MDEVTPDSVRALLKEGGFATANISWRCLPGGRNNRAYQVDTLDGPVLLKQYYRGGDWDRQAAESRFLLFCAKHGVGRVPRLLVEDKAGGLSLHSWIDGRRPEPDLITGRDIAEAAAFLDDLQRASRECDLSRMPPARDAALCLEDFFRSPRKRLMQLQEALLANPDDTMVTEALAFYENELLPGWKRVSAKAYAMLVGEDLTRPFQAGELFVSPSDIGFHNALRLNSSSLMFLDFEYAGLDSPIKAIGDFICQADYPVPYVRMRHLIGYNIDCFVKKLLPLFVIKFCCIVINEFKEPDNLRRSFASRNQVSRKEQLQKGRAILAGLLNHTEYYGVGF